MLGLLRSEQVQKELDLVDEQVDKLKEISETLQPEMRGRFAALRELGPEERRQKIAELREKAKSRAEEVRKKIDEVLLPHQRDRLKQIILQLRGHSALDDQEIAKELGITENQEEEIRRIRTKIQDRMRAMWEGLRSLGPEERRAKAAALREEVRKLRQEAVQQALGILTPEQTEKLEKMKGEKFELDRSRIGPRRLMMRLPNTRRTAVPDEPKNQEK